MEHRINIITLGVKDVTQLAGWYHQTFGWTASKDSMGTIFFRLDTLLLLLVPEHTLAKRLYTWADDDGFKRFSLTIGFNSEKEIDELFKMFREKKVAVIREPERIEGGIYRGYISDPEDNFWELAFYPHVQVNDARERFTIPEITCQ